MLDDSPCRVVIEGAVLHQIDRRPITGKVEYLAFRQSPVVDPHLIDQTIEEFDHMAGITRKGIRGLTCNSHADSRVNSYCRAALFLTGYFYAIFVDPHHAAIPGRCYMRKYTSLQNGVRDQRCRSRSFIGLEPETQAGFRYGTQHPPVIVSAPFVRLGDNTGIIDFKVVGLNPGSKSDSADHVKLAQFDQIVCPIEV